MKELAKEDQEVTPRIERGSLVSLYLQEVNLTSLNYQIVAIIFKPCNRNMKESIKFTISSKSNLSMVSGKDLLFIKNNRMSSALAKS